MAYLPTDEDLDAALDAEPTEGSDITLQSSVPSFGPGTTTSDLRDRVGQISGDFGGAVSRFYDTAGPSRTFGDEERGTLTDAISGQGDFGAGAGLVNAKYMGGAGLGSDQIGRFQQQVGETQAIADPLARGRNLTAWQQQQTPGLTWGEARFNAQQDPYGVMTDALGATQDIRGVRREMGQGIEETTAFGAQRAQEEEDIRRQSREFVGEAETRRAEELDRRAQEENQRVQELTDAWRQMRDTQDPSSLAGYLDQETLGRLTGGSTARTREAEKVYQKVMDNPRYESIKDIPPGKLVIDTDGIERVHITVDGKDYNTYRLKRAGERIPGMSKQESVDIGHLAESRQAELERWFSPVTGRTQNVLNKASKGEHEAISSYQDWFAERGGRGEYADVLSLYDEELGLRRQEPMGLENYITMNMAPEATMGNMATEREAEELNRIYDLLGRQGDFTRSDREAPSLQADTERFQEEELANYMENLSRLRSGEQGQRDEMRAARQFYVDEKNKWKQDLAMGLSVIPIGPMPLAFMAGAKGVGSMFGSGPVAVDELPDFDYTRRY